MPLGDLFDLQNQAGGLNVPAPFMPSGPVLSLFSGLFMNKDPFTGREVVGPADKGNEAEARAAWLARQLLPNTPALPGSYPVNKVMNGIAGSTGETLDVPLLGEYTGEDYYGRKQNLPRALLDTLTGTKIREVDLDRERQYKIGDLRREQSQLRGQLRSVNRDARMGERAKEKRIEELRQLLQDNAQAVADVPVP